MYLALQVVPYGAGQSLLLVRDVTRQMRLEAMRKDFVANASHELRTPLTVISGYLDTLADDPGIDATWAGPIRDMRAQAQRMNAIITDLLELSRLESTDGEAPREPIDVPRMLERLHRDALAKSERPRQVLLELESADGLFGAAHEIESAFTNLLVNGLKYTLADGTVRMRWWTDRGGRAFFGDRYRHRHSRRSTFRGSPSASTGSMRAVPAARAARALGSPSSSMRCSAMAAGSTCRASRARAALSPVISRPSESATLDCVPPRARDVTNFPQAVDARDNRM